MSNTPRPPRPAARTVRVKALYAWTPQRGSELGLTRGDEIEIIEVSEQGWTYGKCHASGRSGWFPINYTEDVVEEPTQEESDE